MPEQTPISYRFRPPIRAYYRENIRVTFSFGTKATALVSLTWLIASAVVGAAVALGAPELSDSVSDEVEARILFGLAGFVLSAFFVVTPVRMWRRVRWVVSLEEALSTLRQARTSGATLLNEEVDNTNQDEWLLDWVNRIDSWSKRTLVVVSEISHAEASGFETLGTVERRLRAGGGGDYHNLYRDMTAQRLAYLQEFIERHAPRPSPL